MCDLSGIGNNNITEFLKKIFDRPSFIRQLLIQYRSHGLTIDFRENRSMSEIEFKVGQQFS
jgi:hypothetical protein